MEFYQSHRQKIMVSADDFGVSPRANSSILHLISLGKIDRVGVMIHGQFSDEEISTLNRSGVKLDIHLDILHKFHNKRAKKQSATWRVLEFFGKMITGKISSKKVENDWREQIEKFREIFGRNPDGINSHEHVHFFPPFFKITLKLKNKYSIPYIRFGDSIPIFYNQSVAHILHWLKIFNHRAYKLSDCISSESLVSLDWIKNIDNFLNNLPKGKTEIVCHPENADDFVRIKKYF
jgi:predicted glycoside hydrolase/deacetylase ChbG (UPF0249 family)